MNVTLDQPRLPSRWLLFVGLWLLFSLVWASQLYFGGYIKSWGKAFAQEAVYWLSWGIVAPLVFWLCRQLQKEKRGWVRYAAGLLLGATAVTFIQPVLFQSLTYAQSWLEWRLSISQTSPPAFLATWYLTAVKTAGGSLTVYAALVFA